jgi:competence protein ComEC
VLYKEIPFLRIGLPLCAGIISGLYFKPEILFLVMMLITIISGFLISLFYNKYQVNYLFGFSFTISLFLCGLLLHTYEKNSITQLASEKSLFSITLSDYPGEKDKTYLLAARLNGIISPENFKSIKGSIVIYCRKDSVLASFLPGDRLLIWCTPLEITNRGNPYEFDYQFYMKNHGNIYYAVTNRSDIISHSSPKHRKLAHRALIIREKIIEMYRARGIRENRLAMIAAITLGQKKLLDPEEKQSFINAGIMHIMAVSGLHAGIISMFVFSMLFFLKGRLNILRVLITIMVLWSFAFVTGLTSSVLRATLMFSFIQAGYLLKRRVNGINSVLASAFVLILIRPSVIFDAGFLLSYSAVIYLISFYQGLYLKLHFKNWLSDKIWQAAVVTIIAQAGTLPLTIMLFNRFPTYFIITNIIIVPISFLLIISGCLVPLLYPVKFLSGLIAVLINHLTGLTGLITKKVSSLPWSTIENIGMTNSESFLLSVTIFLLLCLFLKRTKLPFYYFLAALLFYSASVAFQNINTRVSNELIVYNTPGCATIGIRTGKILNLYSDTTLPRPEVLKHCATQGLKLNTHTVKEKSVCLVSGGKKIIIGANPDNDLIERFMPHIIIFTGSRPGLSNISYGSNTPEALIISSRAGSFYKIPDTHNCAATDTIHLVSKSGAFRIRI